MLTDRVSVDMDDLMPHFFQGPVLLSRHFPVIKILPIFFTAFNLAFQLGDVRVGT